MIKKILLVLVIVCTIGWAYQTKTDDNAEGNDVNQGEKVVPNYINYQGYLTDNSGNPVNGSKSITFSIWTALSVGSQLWNTNPTVNVEDGLFNVNLSVPYSVFSSGARRWLQIKVDTQTLSPRTEITSAGFSYRTTKSDTASYANNSDKLDNHNWGDLYPNSDKLDNYHAGNSSGQIPVSNGTKCTNLNADMLDGYHASDFGTGNGTVTSVGSGTGLTGGPITTTGTLSFDQSWGDGKYVNEGQSNSISTGMIQSDAVTASKIDLPQLNLHHSTTSSNIVWVRNTTSSPHNYPALVGQGRSAGVYGIGMSTGSGVYGVASEWIGVEGFGKFGGYFTDGNAQGYVGVTLSGTKYKIYGDGNVACMMATREGKKVLFAPECPEPYFEDFGQGRLSNGHAHIELDPLFSDCIKTDAQYPMKVFIQLNDDCNGVYVKTETTGFDVYELQGGNSNASFTYRVVANRKDTDYLRFPVAEDPVPKKKVVRLGGKK